MNVVICGYGQMGRAVAQAARLGFTRAGGVEVEQRESGGVVAEKQEFTR